MDAKSDEAILIGYALNSKAYKVFNKTSLVVEESIHVVFDETNAAPKKVVLDEDANVDTSFCPSYHGSSAPKKKKSLSQKEEKWLKMTFKELIFFPSTSGLVSTY